MDRKIFTKLDDVWCIHLKSGEMTRKISLYSPDSSQNSPLLDATAPAVTTKELTWVSLYEKRKKIHPRQVKGLFQNIRVFTIWSALAVYFLIPWLSWEGQQAVLFNLPERQFKIFWLTFWPQDFVFLSWLMIIAFLSLFFITVVAGRVFCGYVCPQTVWTKIFMWIEKTTEGNRNQRLRLDDSPWTVNKIWRRSSKHVLWLLVAFATAAGFLAYFTPVKQLAVDMINVQLGPWQSFWLLFFTAATYMNAGWMREQVCLYMCPYGRFQSVMLDKNSLVISYDFDRGESRGARKRSADPAALGLGDCIDCMQCVHVCPTGIDIRDGLQYQCIGCAACIDACDNIMEKMGYQKGLVKYTTENDIEGKPSHFFRPRVLAYGLVLFVFVAGFLLSMALRVPLDLDIIRDRNQLYRVTGAGMIENVYTLKVMNKTQAQQQYYVRLSSQPGVKGIRYLGDPEVTVKAGEIFSLPVRVEADPEFLQARNSVIYFEVWNKTNTRHSVIEESRFISPAGQGF